MKALRYFLMLLTLLSTLSIQQAFAAKDYSMSTGDLVRVSVYDQPDLTMETRVDENGAIIFPLIGKVAVGGLTASEASGSISKALESGGFIKSAQVNVVIMEFKGQEVSVLGLVNRPGKFALEKSSRLTDMLALAGGTQPGSADTLILLSNRGGKSDRKEIDLQALFSDSGSALNVEVANNDILYVPREPRFYIYGEVQRPGSFRLEKGMTLVQALSVGGGLTQRGTQKGIQIMRHLPDGGLKTLEGKLSDTLKADDVIYVKESLF